MAGVGSFGTTVNPKAEKRAGVFCTKEKQRNNEKVYTCEIKNP
jgi:hypothetical protein